LPSRRRRLRRELWGSLPLVAHVHSCGVAWRATGIYRKFTLRDNMVLAADQTTGIVARCDVAEPNVTRQATEKWNTLSDEHGNTRDGETLNEACAQEALNGDAAVHVEVLGTAGGELRDDLLRRPAHLFDDATAGRGQIKWATTEDDDALVSIGPRSEAENCLEGVATHHDRIDGGYEFIVAMSFATVRR
jgi:hypothetical protein